MCTYTIIICQPNEKTNPPPTLSLLRSGIPGSILMLSCTCCCRSSAAGCRGPRRPVQTLTCLILNKSTLTNKRLRFVSFPIQTNLYICINLNSWGLNSIHTYFSANGGAIPNISVTFTFGTFLTRPGTFQQHVLEIFLDWQYYSLLEQTFDILIKQLMKISKVDITVNS